MKGMKASVKTGGYKAGADSRSAKIKISRGGSKHGPNEVKSAAQSRTTKQGK